MRVRHSSLFFAVAAFTAVVAGAEEKDKSNTVAAATRGDKIVHAAGIEWGDPPARLPRGGKAAVLFGDPTKSGWFTTRLQAPAGYRIPPHTHPTAEHVTVISGSVHLGSGGEVAGRVLQAGDYAVLAAGSKHSAWFTEDSVIQIQSEGPFAMEYADPADDPRGAKR